MRWADFPPAMRALVVVAVLASLSAGLIVLAFIIGTVGSPAIIAAFWKWTTHDSTSFYTFMLALFTGVLSASTIMLWFATRRSALIAERALTEYERPWLFLQGATVRRRENPGQALIPNNFFIKLRWKNIGRAPALVESCTAVFADEKKLAPHPDYSKTGPLSTNGTISVDEECDTNEIGPAATAENAQITYVMYGRITYTELNGKRHETGYALHISPHIAAFSRYSVDAYDYYT
jgi:hypothetical protein